MSDELENKKESYQNEERKNKRKAVIARLLETLNYIILPIQYLTKDIFLLFYSYQSALDVAIPVLRFMTKNLSWLYGISFILEGICALIEASRSENEDKRAFLIGQGSLLIIGGVILAVFAITNPQIFLPLLCALWGASTVMFLYDVARDMLVQRRQVRHQLKTLHSFRELLDGALDPDARIYPSDKDRIHNLIVVSFDKSIKLLNIHDVDTLPLRAEIMEKIAQLQDKKSFVTPKDIDGIIQDIMNSEKFSGKINNNVLLSAAYISISFICALATFIFLGKSDLSQSIIFSHLIITAGMISKRLYDFITNPIIKKAQFQNISSRDMDQLSNEGLRVKYLKKMLEKLDKRTRKLLDHFDKVKLQSILNDYATVVEDINQKDSPYTALLSDLSTLVHDHENDDDELRQLALALQQSIGSRMLYLESNHSCMLCSAMRSLAEEKNRASQPQLSNHATETLYHHDAEYELANQKHQLSYSVKDINKQCGKLLASKHTQIQRKASYDSLSVADKTFPTSNQVVESSDTSDSDDHNGLPSKHDTHRSSKDKNK